MRTRENKTRFDHLRLVYRETGRAPPHQQIQSGKLPELGGGREHKTGKESRLGDFRRIRVIMIQASNFLNIRRPSSIQFIRLSVRPLFGTTQGEIIYEHVRCGGAPGARRVSVYHGEQDLEEVLTSKLFVKYAVGITRASGLSSSKGRIDGLRGVGDVRRREGAN